MAELQMREGNIYNSLSKIEGRFTSIYKQLRFLDMRMVSYEKVMGSRMSVLKAIWNPSWLGKEVDRVQLEMMKQHDEEMKKLAETAKQEAMKPKLISPNGLKIVGLILMLMFSGCVTKSFHNKEMKRMYDEAYEGANLECLTLQKRIKDYIESLQARLRLFNQVGPGGELYPLKPNWNGDKTGKVDGKEDWQK